MKLYYIGKPAVQLCAEHELSEFSRWTRNEYASFMTMFSKTIAERTKPGQRNNVEEQDYVFHCYARTEGIAAVIISKDYPSLTAHTILSKVLDEFLSQDRRTADAKRNPKDNSVTFAELRQYLDKYQDPAQASSITAIQQQLDETKIILHKTIDSVLQRGEKIDDLVAKSSDLSNQSKAFYQTAKKQNSCCLVM
ncbi:Longin-like domain-containing protein [Phialemonium atrogriseum]|uniref:Longin-like domain-containing protein n=1 Tax=Phialemonium atrogriseum TaxID=1093897 RepID=A0AAJ0FIN8_9PEZI|nr:Longin-like domain-containing protein [Phialemonium atrogriseum]KAK1763514.1 Longin-like domain-containing protein [Phialemonium atrogriseum]